MGSMAVERFHSGDADGIRRGGVRESGDDTSAGGDTSASSDDDDALDAFDDEPCLACGGATAPEICPLRRVPRGGHYDCLGLDGVPAGDWFCAGCAREPNAAAAVAEKKTTTTTTTTTTPKRGPADRESGRAR